MEYIKKLWDTLLKFYCLQVYHIGCCECRNKLLCYALTDMRISILMKYYSTDRSIYVIEEILNNLPPVTDEIWERMDKLYIY